MYRVLRSPQAINEPSIIYRRQQHFSTCITTYPTSISSSLICHGSRLDGHRSLPQYTCVSPSWKAEQRRKLGVLNQRVNHKFRKGRGLTCYNGKSARSRALAEPERRQILNIRSISHSHGLCATEFQEQPEIDSVSIHGNPIKRDAESINLKLPIRERLRIWEAANPTGVIKDVMADSLEPGRVQNTAMKGSNDAFIVDPQPDDTGGNNSAQLFFEQGELADLGDNRPFLLRGDLVELNLSNQRQPEFAIYVRQSGSYSQFYTMSGKWVNRTSSSVVFYVPKFVASEEVNHLLPYLPAADSPLVEQNKLQSFENALPRQVGAPLVEKMLKFRHLTEEVCRNFADTLDQAYQTVASDKVLEYYTLQQLASKLLPQSAKLPNGQFPMHFLYAVHRAVMQHSFGFRTEGANHRHGSRNGSRYEIVPKTEYAIVDKVTDYVRKFQEKQVTREISQEQDDLPLAKFIMKAQHLIDISRQHRNVTKSGTLGPLKSITSKGLKAFKPKSRTEFTGSDLEIIRFMESWVAMRHFGAGSVLNGIGSLILRATRRYDGFDLNTTTAWTFLQEIGILAPWNNRTAFDLRLPHAGFQLSAKKEIPEIVAQAPNDSLLKDRMEVLRTDWASLPVYCVDDAGAQEIDDGVSLERIGNSLDEYWIHIHTADPASHIDPSSDIARNAEDMISSIYLPERKVSMIPGEITSRFSLANGRPSLTFSAKINNAGDILDIKITPGYVRNVKFMTPSVIDEIVSGTIPSENEAATYTVGQSMPSELSNSHPISERVLLQATELTDEDKENLRKLSALGFARQQKGIKRGALPPAASDLLHVHDTYLSVQLKRDILPPSPYAKHYESDPKITIGLKYRHGKSDDIEVGVGHKTVTNLMLLGGEVCARWCHDRGIPIPYRVSPQNPEQADAPTYFREIVLPALQNPGEETRRKVEAYLLLAGRVSLSTTAGPHLFLGVSKFAKCTSPLRRYGDLLVHWQIEAALLEEERTGQSSLLGSTREDYLPFSRNAIDDLIPTLDSKERAVRKAQRDAEYSWAVQFVLRAWKFKECTLPRTFECQISSVRLNPHQLLLTARINFLGISAQLEAPEWMMEGKINTGDIYECEFSDVDFYRRKIFLKPLRRIEGGDAQIDYEA